MRLVTTCLWRHETFSMKYKAPADTWCCSSDEGDLARLSSLGHFLKGSSATLGLVKVREGCEKMQRYGRKENVDGSSEPDEKLCLDRIFGEIKAVKADVAEAQQALDAYYDKDKASDA